MDKFSQYKEVGKNILWLSLILLITFFIWYFSYAYIQDSVITVFNWLVYQIAPRPSAFQMLITPLAEAGLTPLQTFKLMINRYGAILISLLISALACISVLRKILSRKRIIEPMKFMYVIQFILAFFVGAAMLFGYFVEFNPIRVSRFFLMIGPIVTGLVVYGGSDKITGKWKTKTRSTFTVIIAAVTICMVALSLGSVYGSSRTIELAPQVTNMEIAGIEWFENLKHPFKDIVVAENYPGQVQRFEDYIFGTDFFDITRVERSYRPPSHFGYDEYDYVVDAFNYSAGARRVEYIILFEMDKVAPMIFPENVRPLVHQYTQEDLAMLNSDPTVAKIYSNGEFELWRICGRDEAS